MSGGRLGLPRRQVLAGAGAALIAGPLLSANTRPIPIIDTHIHLFDPKRPQGAPYRGPKNAPSYERGAFPGDYARLARRYGVVGAIEVEASPWIEDNLWVLETAERDGIMVGTIGNIPLDLDGFAPMLARYAKNPLFRGLRYGNLWGYDLAGRSGDPKLLAGLRQLAEADLVLDTANPRLDLLQAVIRVNDTVPSLRIVIDHLPHFEPRPEEQAEYQAVVREIGSRPNLFVKLSEVIHPIDGKVSRDLEVHRGRLQFLVGTLSVDQVMFGSDWPNILQDAALDDVFAIVRTFYAEQPLVAQEKYFWRNSLRAYRWRPRTPEQRRLFAS